MRKAIRTWFWTEHYPRKQKSRPKAASGGAEVEPLTPSMPSPRNDTAATPSRDAVQQKRPPEGGLLC